MGRSVRGFDQGVWETHRSSIVIAGNLAKFSQSADLRDFLLASGRRVLVEASPVDRIWGVGLAADDDHIVVGLVKAAVVGHRAQVGYVVDKAHWGRGLATAAVRRLLPELEATPTRSRIWATCALDNPASARVLEKAGFEREAILKKVGPLRRWRRSANKYRSSSFVMASGWWSSTATSDCARWVVSGTTRCKRLSGR